MGNANIEVTGGSLLQCLSCMSGRYSGELVFHINGMTFSLCDDCAQIMSNAMRDLGCEPISIDTSSAT